MTKNEAVDLIVRSHSRTYSGTESNSHQIVRHVIETHLGNPDSFKSISTNSIIDLLIFFQKPERRMSEFRTKVMPLLEERTKTLPTGYLLNYIRRVINVTDTVPGMDYLNVVQSKNILEFLSSQENIKEISPPYLYTLVQTIISDTKVSSRSTTDVSFSKLIEKHRIENGINNLLNKIPREEG